MPTSLGERAMADQAEAATEAATRHITRLMAASSGGSPVETRDDSGLAGEVIIRLFLEWARGKPSECGHDPLGQRAAYWMPEWPALLCQICLTAMCFANMGTEADRTCDVCRRVVPPDETWANQAMVIPGHPSPERPSGVAAPVIILYAVCARCPQ